MTAVAAGLEGLVDRLKFASAWQYGDDRDDIAFVLGPLDPLAHRCLFIVRGSTLARMPAPVGEAAGSIHPR